MNDETNPYGLSDDETRAYLRMPQTMRAAIPVARRLGLRAREITAFTGRRYDARTGMILITDRAKNGSPDHLPARHETTVRPARAG